MPDGTAAALFQTERHLDSNWTPTDPDDTQAVSRSALNSQADAQIVAFVESVAIQVAELLLI
jgi:hypothetical protein